MENLSVTIITKNEEKNIGRCLESLKWADEIVVVDTSSTDRTVEICRQHTEKIFSESWHGYGKQKNICAMHAKNRWILNIDADEVVTSASAEEIEKLILLLDGMKDSTSDLNELMQGFENSIDVSLLSSTVEGGKL